MDFIARCRDEAENAGVLIRIGMDNPAILTTSLQKSDEKHDKYAGKNLKNML